MKKIINALKAFSLIELMISLIAISTITAAFTPVISQKIKDNTITIGKMQCPAGCIFCKNEKVCTLCQSGYRESNGECISCNPSDPNDKICLSCGDNGKCTQCKVGYFINGTGCKKCDVNNTICAGKELVCPMGYYPDKSNGKCEQCSDGCTSCTSGTACLSCKTGYFINNSGGCSPCPEGSSCTARDSACPFGYVLNSDNNKCLPCDAGCDGCINKSATKCENCKPGYYKSGGSSSNGYTCTKCPDHATCSGGTTSFTCGYGYFEKSGKCYTCDTISKGGKDKCEACGLDGSSVKCALCKTGYYINSTGDCTKCPAGATCENSKDIACPAGFYRDGSACKICDPSCVECEGSGSTNCSKAAGCRAGYYAKQSTGNKLTCGTCPPGATCSGGSDYFSCMKGYYQNGATCTPCDAACDGCSASDGTKCNACRSGYYKSGGSSSNGYTCTACPDNATCDGGVREFYCNSGYYKSGSTCKQCPANATCNGGSEVPQCKTDRYYWDATSGKCKEMVFNTLKKNGLTWMLRNVGDDSGPPIPSSVNGVTISKLTAGTTYSTLSDGTPACWQGTTANTAGSRACSNKTSYDGCTRTVCNWYAANLICSYYGMKLPTRTQVQALAWDWGANNSYLLSKSLNLCDYNNSDSNVSRCQCGFQCKGSEGEACHPAYIWTSEANKSYMYAYRVYNYNLVEYGNTGKGYPLSVRCVSGEMCSERFNESNCTECTDTQCTACKSGYSPNGTKCISCSDKFGSNCTSCDANRCTACSDGNVLIGGGCKFCSYVFGTGCNACTSTKCTGCYSGYQLDEKLNKCTKCLSDEYYDQKSGSCYKCPSTCSKCTDAYNCTTCKTGETPSNGKCVANATAIVTGVKWTTKNAGDCVGTSCGPIIPWGDGLDGTVKRIAVGDTTQEPVSITPACWVGYTANNTSGYNYICTNNTSYSGCNRTVCNWYAANLICEYNGMHLPSSWNLNILTEDKNNLLNGSKLVEFVPNFCDAYSANSNISRCYSTNSCYGARDNKCNPKTIVTNDFSDGDYYVDNYHSSDETLWRSSLLRKDATFSVRCVNCGENEYVNGIQCRKCNKACSGCTGSGEDKCIGCADGYYKSGSTCTACPAKCSKCKSATNCSSCAAGYYLSGSSCLKCHSNCSECTSVQRCTACKSGYTRYGNSCVPSSVTVNNVDGKYWTKFNAGDTNGPTIPASVTKITAGVAHASVGSNPACWQGTTAVTTGTYACTNKGSYSGCNRTVCNFNAANTICASNGMSIPRSSISTSLSSIFNTQGIDAFVSYSGLCTYSNEFTQMSLCDSLDKCYGSEGNWCAPWGVWTYDDYGNIVYIAAYRGNAWSINPINITRAHSVRCVAW